MGYIILDLDLLSFRTSNMLFSWFYCFLLEARYLFYHCSLENNLYFFPLWLLLRFLISVVSAALPWCYKALSKNYIFIMLLLIYNNSMISFIGSSISFVIFGKLLERRKNYFFRYCFCPVLFSPVFYSGHFLRVYLTIFLILTPFIHITVHVDFKGIVLSEKCQSQKVIYHVSIYVTFSKGQNYIDGEQISVY